MDAHLYHEWLSTGQHQQNVSGIYWKFSTHPGSFMGAGCTALGSSLDANKCQNGSFDLLTLAFIMIPKE
eukprot:scaffold284375_cov71-Attheya_sp.AAC.4